MSNTVAEVRMVKQATGSTGNPRWSDWDAAEELETFGKPITENIQPSDDTTQ